MDPGGDNPHAERITAPALVAGRRALVAVAAAPNANRGASAVREVPNGTAPEPSG